MTQLQGLDVRGSSSTLVVSARPAPHASSRSKQRPPKLAAYRVDRDTLVIKVLNGQDPARQGQEERPQQHKAPGDGAVDLRAVVQSRSLQLSGVSCRPLALPDAAPEEGGPFPVPGLRRLARIVSETFLVARLAVRLFTYVGFGYRWISSFLALLAYAMLLMPGFLQMVAFYFLSPRVLRSIRYGPESRNVLDLYLPPGHLEEMGEGEGRPVVVYVTGGAWTIGYKGWGALLSRRLSQEGVIVCCLDYRNFPQGTALDMMADINHGLRWVLGKIACYGGDPDRVYVCGQSCGGHLASLAVLTQAEQQALGQPLPGGLPAWDVSRVRAFIGVSGVYNVHDLVEHFHKRGLYKSLFLKIMSIHDRPELKLLSPVYVAAHSLLQQQRAAQAADEAGVAGSSGSSSGNGAGEGAEDADGEEEDCGEAVGLLAAGRASSGELSEAEGGVHRASAAQQQHLPHAESAMAVHAGCGQQGLGHDSASSLIGAYWGSKEDGGDCDCECEPALTEAAAAARAAAAAARAAEQEGAVDGENASVPTARRPRSSAELVPHMLLLHGDADRCAPVEGAEQFAHALRDAGVSVSLQLLAGETHTSPLLENPMRGGQDALTDAILSLVGGRPVTRAYPSLCPHFLIDLAAKVCPF